MSGKIEFGCDFLHISRDLIMKSRGENNPPNVSQERIADAAARLLLLEWNFTVEEGDEANNLFHERINSNTLSDIADVADRLIRYLGNSDAKKEKFLIQLTALGSLDYDITEEESYAVRFFSDKFDFRPSEFSRISNLGYSLAIGLNYFGEIYMNNSSR